MEDFEHVDQHLIEFDEVSLSEVVTCGCYVAIDYLLFEIFKGGLHASMEEVHRDENAAIKDVQRQFLETLAVFIWGQERSTKLANIRNQLVDVIALEIRVVF